MSFFYYHPANHFLDTLREKGKRVADKDFEPRDFQWNQKYIFFIFKKTLPIVSFLRKKNLKFRISKTYDYDENEFYSILEIDFQHGVIKFEFSKDLIYQDFTFYHFLPNFQAYFFSNVHEMILLLKKKL